MVIFAFTADDRWVLGIGDPTIGGWLTVLAYFVTAWLCWRAARHAQGGPRGPRQFWLIFALGLVLLGINKQMDLQTWFTLAFKELSLRSGWYVQRRAFQAVFIALVALGGVAGLVAMCTLAGRLTRPILLALAGGVFLGCFILVRASSFHHVDRMLGMDLGGLRVNWILELGSIGSIAAAALLAARTRPAGATPSPNFIWISAGDRLDSSRRR